MITIHIDEKDSSLLAVCFPTDTLGNDLVRNVPSHRFSYCNGSHESILTTMRYTPVTADKISTFKSPLDDL
jgi:hypothetical protein